MVDMLCILSLYSFHFMLYMRSNHVCPSHQVQAPNQNLSLLLGTRVFLHLPGPTLAHGVQHLGLTPGGPRTGRGSSERSAPAWCLSRSSWPMRWTTVAWPCCEMLGNVSDWRSFLPRCPKFASAGFCRP